MTLTDVVGSVRLDLIIAVFALFIGWIVKHNLSRPKNFPPGPLALPFFGYVPFLYTIPHELLSKLGKKYGGIFSVECGTQTVVVLSTAKAIREVLAKPELSGRPAQSDFFVIPMNDPFFGNGKYWYEHKKFTLKVFKGLNEGTNMEDQMRAEISLFMKAVDSQQGRPVDIRIRLHSSIANYINSVNFGKTLEENDPDRQKIDINLHKIMKGIEQAAWALCFPWLSRLSLIRKITKVEELESLYHESYAHIAKLVKPYTSGAGLEGKECLLNSYFSELSAKKQRGEECTFSERAAPDALISLYGAGTETTRDTIIWGFYTMAVYQDVQLKVQRELDDFYGRDRMPSYTDQKSLPYTMSFLKELQRLQTAVPLGIRMTTGDVQAGDYVIPKNTVVMVNHWAVHHDEDNWSEPNKFIPERFLSEDGEHTEKLEYYIPFSVGKRKCTGEVIAMVEVFLYITSMVHKYKLKLPAGHKPDFRGFGSVIHQMKNHKIIFLPRD